MKLSQLSAYAEEKYHITEEYQYDNFSILRNPATNEWIALLMWQQDMNSGTIVEYCDIKCGRNFSYEFFLPYISLPYRMHDKQWVGIKMDCNTDADIIFKMFDRAIGIPSQNESTIILKSYELPKKSNHIETILQKYANVSPSKNACHIPQAPTTTYCRKEDDATLQKHENLCVQTESEKNYKNNPVQHENNNYCQYGATIVLRANESPKKQIYVETPIPTRQPNNQISQDIHIASKTQEITLKKLRQRALRALPYIPPKIREMMELCKNSGSFEQKCKNFYIQAKFMADYEDNQPYRGNFHQYFPTYNDLTLEHLRGYFTWRTEVRKGNFHPISTSLAYIYVYELLNGIGANSPIDVLQKLKKFEIGYIDSGVGDIRMKGNLHRWMEEFSIIKHVRPEIAQRYIDTETTMRDKALVILNQPDNYNDTEVFEALCTISTVKLNRSPVMVKDRIKGKQLFANLWRHIFKRMSTGKGTFFNMCFGTPKNRHWYPLRNAIYWQPGNYKDIEYVLNKTRRYVCKNGIWYEQTYHKSYFNDNLFNGLLHEADRLFRIHLQTGHALKKNKDEEWATPYINEVITANSQTKVAHTKPEVSTQFSKPNPIRHDSSVICDRIITNNEPENVKAKVWKSPYFHTKLERAKPKINIQFSKLEQIRRDSAAIYEGLLTDNEPENMKTTEKTINSENRASKSSELPYFHAMMKAKQQAKPKPLKPKINIQFSKLEQIRKDASVICDNLLTEEELWETKTYEKTIEPEPKIEKSTDELLTEIQLKIIRMLLRKEDIRPIIKDFHLMPSIIADEINNALFEQIGDTVLESDGNKLSIIEDYTEDLNKLFGG